MVDTIRECYGKKYNTLLICKSCRYKNYCQDSIQSDKDSRSDWVTPAIGEITERNTPIADYQAGTNISGLVIAELLTLADYDPIKYFVLTLRIGGVSYKEIGQVLEVTDVMICKYMSSLPSSIATKLQGNNIIMVEIAEAWKERKKHIATNEHFKRPKKRLLAQITAQTQGTTH